MRRIVLGIIIIFLTLSSMGQADTSYFNNGLQIKDKSKAKYYQIVTYQSKDSLKAFTTDYHMDNSISTRIYYSNYQDRVATGRAMSWNRSGWVKSIKRYENDTLHGESLVMDSIGRLDIRLFYNKGELYYWERKQDDGTFQEQTIPYETMPIFPGCDELTNEKDRMDCSNQSIYRFIQSVARYPAISRDRGISGTVYVSYIVNKDGQVIDADILKMEGGDKHIAEAALEAVGSFPKFIPGTQAGDTVRVQYYVPVRFWLR